MPDVAPGIVPGSTPSADPVPSHTAPPDTAPPDTAPVNRAPAGTAMTLDVAAARLGGYRWLEHRVFEVLGAWAVVTPDPAAQRLFDLHSGQHAWHAELWADRLPVLDTVDPDALIRPPTPGAVELFDSLESLSGAGADREGAAGGGGGGGGGAGEGVPTLLRLVGVYRVLLPRLVTGYRVHLERGVPATDGPVIRALGLVIADESAAWQAGELLVQERFDAAASAEAGALQYRLESHLTGGRVTSGFSPWPLPEEGLDASGKL